MDRILLEKSQDFDVISTKERYPHHISDCVVLPSQQMVFTDRRINRLIIHNVDGTYEKDIRLPDDPLIITTVDRDNVGVTYAFKTYFDIVNINTNIIEKTVSASKHNWLRGLSYGNGKFYVAVKDEGVKVLVPEGIVTNTILTQVEDLHRIIIHNNRLYYTCFSYNKVHCCDLTGEQIWVFTDERILRNFNSAPITVTGYGNVFVACRDDSIILLISSDGQNNRKVYDKSNSLQRPSAISYDKENNQLLVYNDKNGRAYLYKIQNL